MKLSQPLKLKPLARVLELRADAYDKDKRTMRLSVSSEKPVDRWFGTEILDHEPNSVRLARFNNGANVLFNHSVGDVIGVIEQAWLEDKRLLAEIRIARTARGDEIAGMIADGILRSVSVGYRIHEVLQKPKTEEYRAVDWEPYELSIVTVPADPSVGIGREQDGDELEVRMRNSVSPAKPANLKGVTAMTTETVETPTAGANAGADPNKLSEPTAANLERARNSALSGLGEKYGIDHAIVRKWIDAGTTVNAAGDEVVGILEERSKKDVQSVAMLGLSKREKQGYNFLRAVRAASDQNWHGAGLELEAHLAVSKALGRFSDDPKKFLVPLDIQERAVDPAVITSRILERLVAGLPIGAITRDLNVAVGSQGGFLVGTDNQGFIELLRNRSVAFRMGARRLSGLRENVTIPRHTGAGTAVWLSSETATATESTQTLGQLALLPKTVGAYTEISRLLTLQSSPDAESLVMADLASVVAIAADLASLEGSGAGGQPTGISNTAGIGTVTGTTLGYAGILEFQTDVASANVMPVRGGYATTPPVAALMLQRARFTNTDTPLWVGNLWDGAMSGFPAMSSNQLTAATMIFGDWDKLVIGEWGVLEIEVNPYASFQAGIIGVRAMYTMDVGLRYPAAFSRATAIT